MTECGVEATEEVGLWRNEVEPKPDLLKLTHASPIKQ